MSTHKPPGDPPTDSAPVQEMTNPYAPLALDGERYAHYLNDLDVSDEDARRFMEELWGLIGSFVDMGFGLDAAQIVLDAFSKAIEDGGNAQAEVYDLKPLMDEAAANPGKDKNDDD